MSMIWNLVGASEVLDTHPKESHLQSVLLNMIWNFIHSCERKCEGYFKLVIQHQAFLIG